MKTYIGTRRANAKPMTRQEYNDFRNWALPEDEEGTDEGYLVEYAGEQANTDEYEGYVSWSPKEVFENFYRLAETFYDRLGIEEEELSTKLKSLGEFLTAKKFSSLSEQERKLIEQQNEAMRKYLALLSQRIAESKA